MRRTLSISDGPRLATIGVVLATTLLLSACSGWSFDVSDEIIGSGDVITETRDVDGFDTIDFRAFGTLIIEEGTRDSLTVRGDDNLMGRVETYTEGDRLVIEIEDGIIPLPSDGFEYVVTVRDLRDLDVAGAGRVVVDGFTGDALDVDFSGAGTVDLRGVDVETLEVSFTGAGQMLASGRATFHDARISGAGNYDAGSLATAETTLSSSGAGNAEVWATDELTIDSSGVGKVSYWGSPNTDISTSGIGGVEELGDK
ncbi:MAG: DUF2807 domain-containing protein [Acidimicrobiia bacterium]|nr:DUF2807 domain-containing protein [Acidimicrobiia bacterium]